ncbi:hypothetical protein [Helicobacter ganmani]|uniref:hypothetical protein n=1 Tax=Helicobacter ganmani TaxID=60246 RepID=UPI003A8C0DFD
MSKNILLFISLFSMLFIAGCSSKVQTNKLPDSKKYHLPTTNTNQTLNIDKKEKDSFESALQDFFLKDFTYEEINGTGLKRKIPNKDIYQIGLERGHFQ